MRPNPNVHQLTSKMLEPGTFGRAYPTRGSCPLSLVCGAPVSLMGNRAWGWNTQGSHQAGPEMCPCALEPAHVFAIRQQPAPAGGEGPKASCQPQFLLCQNKAPLTQWRPLPARQPSPPASRKRSEEGAVGSVLCPKLDRPHVWAAECFFVALWKPVTNNMCLSDMGTIRKTHTSVSTTGNKSVIHRSPSNKPASPDMKESLQ